MDPYTEAHLFVSAIRVCEYKNGGTADIKDICKLLEFSDEYGLALCRNLEKEGVVKSFEDPFSFKVSVEDYQTIEKFPKKIEEKSTIAKELEEFYSKKVDMDQKVANIQAELDRKKKDMFADLEAKFKKEMGKGD